MTMCSHILWLLMVRQTGTIAEITVEGGDPNDKDTHTRKINALRSARRPDRSTLAPDGDKGITRDGWWWRRDRHDSRLVYYFLSSLPDKLCSHIPL